MDTPTKKGNNQINDQILSDFKNCLLKTKKKCISIKIKVTILT